MECHCCGDTFPDSWGYSAFTIRGFGTYNACEGCTQGVTKLLIPTHRCKGEFLFEPLPAGGGGEPIGPRITFRTSADLRAYLSKPVGDVRHRLGFRAHHLMKEERTAWLAGGELVTPVGKKLQWFEGPQELEELQAFRGDPDRVEFEYYDEEAEWICPEGIQSRIKLLKGKVKNMTLEISKLQEIKVDQNHALEESDTEGQPEE